MRVWTTEKTIAAELAERMFGWKWVWAETDVPGAKRIALVSPEQMREAEHYKRPYQLADTQSVEKIPSKSLWSARWATEEAEALKVVHELHSRGYTVTLRYGQEAVACEVQCWEGKNADKSVFSFNPPGLMARTICEAAIKVLNEEWE